MTMPTPDDPAISEALDESLEQLRRGQSIDECLSRYPDIEDELRPLLTAAASMVGVAPNRDDSARRTTQFRFEGALRHHLATRQRRSAEPQSLLRWWNSRVSRWSRVWAVGFATMALFVMLSAGAAYASTDALPDSALYPVKRATEHARLAITFSDESRAIYHLELIERRTLELAAVAETGDTEQVAQLSRDVLKNIEFARLEAGYMETDASQQQEDEPQEAIRSRLIDDASQQSIRVGDGDAASDAAAKESTLQLSVDQRPRGYIEAERSTATRAYAMLQIAHQVASPHARSHVLSALTLAEQRYRQTRYVGEPAPISRTLFVQGVVVTVDDRMTIGGRLPFEISGNGLGNRPPRDGDAVTVGGYIRDDGVLLVLRLYAFEADGIADDQIWLQAETLGRNDEHIFIPGFNVTPKDWGLISQPSNGVGHWIYVYGTLTTNGAVAGEDIHLLGDGPILFPRP